ncbi:MAG: NADH-quinone oxidoreductase subunit L [Acidobacteriia bacterium]|nr:NADH-quinone oxidoreductase subunit L [Terriglobia bacterium]
MLELLWLIPILPFASFFILALFGRRFSQTGVAIIGAGFAGVSALLTILIAFAFISTPPPGYVYSQSLWEWISVAGFSAGISFYLDPLSLIFASVITFVGFFILLYSIEFMSDEEGYSRFFAYMNLFVGSMLCLVLADNLLFLYLGWEGVGLCSYLLIGFWYKDPVNGYAARKAFVVTRIGDTAMAVGLFLLFHNLGTLNIHELLQQAVQRWATGSSLALAASLLLLGGAIGKSAQLPLQTWLPDAMAGPTPVSALIHAATMVTAGVYLIARTHALFELSPVALTIVATIGALTLLISSFSGITQVDIKRVLAYSTISQIGYMFLALGVGAWSAGVFHFMTHAFFKALLFLGAGVVILSQHHEHNMFKMGGLRERLPLTFWTFLLGSGSLAAFPLITAGFYSKDSIIWYAWSGAGGGAWLYLAALVGALLTALYTFRMVFVTFFGPARTQISHKPGLLLQLPLVILAALSVIGGFVELPETLGHFTPFADFLGHALPAAQIRPEAAGQEGLFEIVSIAVSLSGICLAYLLFLRRRKVTERFTQTAPGGAMHSFFFAGWGFDWLYEKILVQPYLWICRINRNDFIDLFYGAIAWCARLGHAGLSATETGQVRLYAAVIGVGAVIAIALAVFL